MDLDPADRTGVAVRDRVLHDLFIAALDHAEWIWSSTFRDDPYLFEAHIVDVDSTVHHVTRATMVRGLLAAALSWRERITWDVEYPPTPFDKRQEWAFTPADADLVLQLGVYRDVRFPTEELIRRGILSKPNPIK